MKIDLSKIYYIGNKKNTVEFRLVEFKFNPVSRIIDGKETITHTPIDQKLFRLDHLQGKAFGNTWTQGEEFFTTKKRLLNANIKI